jgi:hypothetical protein
VEELAVGLVHVLVGVRAQTVALGLEQVRGQPGNVTGVLAGDNLRSIKLAGSGGIRPTPKPVSGRGLCVVTHSGEFPRTDNDRFFEPGVF